jgi:enterochelin esterase-like enzyme
MRKSFWTAALFVELLFASFGCQLTKATETQSTSEPSPVHHLSPLPQSSPQSVEQQNLLPDPSRSSASVPLSYQYETYTSRAMGQQRSYGVSLPPGYDQHPNQRYPVIFLLHGGHGDQTDWWQPGKGNALVTLKQLYQTSGLPPSIIITPDGNDKRGSSRYWDPEYIDGKDGKVATAIGDELVKVVQSRYRTLPTPDFWAIGGLSSGGWGAINIGLHHPDHFSVLFSHSGYFTDRSGAQNSPLQFVSTLPEQVQQRLRIYMDTGLSDKDYLEQARAFHHHLEQLGITNQFQAFPGSHTWDYWHQHLTDSLTFVGNQFKNSQLANSP